MLSWLFIAICSISTLVLLKFVLHTIRFTSRLPLINQISIPPEMSWPGLTLVIPCCNEETVLRDFLNRRMKDLEYPDLKIIFVNDRSTEGTAQTLQTIASLDHRVQVHTITSLPSSWLGKVNALKEGSTLAKTEWIAFADADSEFSPLALRKAMVLAQRESLDYLGVFPHQKSRGFAYRCLVAFFEHASAMMINLDHLENVSRSDAFGTGAFALLKSKYVSPGTGWDWLRLDVVDDRALPLMLKLSGAKIGLAHGYKEISIEWYDSALAMMRGVEKNAFAIHEFKPFLVYVNMIRSIVWLLMLFSAAFFTPLPILRILFLLALLLYYAATAWQYWKFNHRSVWPVIFLPISGFLFCWFLIRGALISIRQGGIMWRDTFYSNEDLKPHQRVFFISKRIPPAPD